MHTDTDTESVDTPTDADRTEYERRGNALIGLLPHDAQTRLIASLVHYGERAAGRNADYGDITAETVSLTLSLFAQTVGSAGIPTDDDYRAILVSVCAKRAAQSAKASARRQWAPRSKAGDTDADTETVPAPNTIGSWKNDALIRRAERYTNGSLNGGSWNGACVPTSYRLRFGIGGCRYSSTVAGTATDKPRTLAAAIIDARDESSLARVMHAPRLGMGGCKHTAPAAQSSPGARPDSARGSASSAESVFWNERRVGTLTACLESSLALNGIDRDALTDSADSDPIWTRTNGIHWNNLATVAGIDRGTLRYRIRAAAGIAVRIAGRNMLYRDEAGKLALVSVPDTLKLIVGGYVPESVPAPAHPAVLPFTIAPAPAGTRSLQGSFLRSVPSMFLSRGDDTFTGTPTDDAPMAYGAAAYVVDRGGRTVPAYVQRADDTAARWGFVLLARAMRAAVKVSENVPTGGVVGP